VSLTYANASDEYTQAIMQRVPERNHMAHLRDSMISPFHTNNCI